jgi:hypothetical protein
MFLFILCDILDIILGWTRASSTSDIITAIKINKGWMIDMNIVDFAWQIIRMNNTIEELLEENKRLSKIEKKYNDLLTETINSQRQLFGKLLVSNLHLTDSKND